MSSGWIKLHRQLLEWEWYDDINTTRLFIHLLLLANHKDRNWRGINIKRGQLITGRITLSKQTKLSEQQIRTCLGKLKSTNEITTKPTNRNTLITLVKYNEYQDKKESSTSKSTNHSTNKQPTDNQQITTNNNDNNVNNDNKGKDIAVNYSCFLNFNQEQLTELKRIRKTNKGGKITQRVANALAKEFNQAELGGFTIEQSLTEWEVRGWKSFKAEWMKTNNGKRNYSDVTTQNINTLEAFINE